MKKRYFSFIILVIIQIIVLVGCSNSDSISSGKEKDIKEAIDLVLSYENGYDETMKKHISEKNFYVCNYKEYYSLYIGDATIEEYESKVVNTFKDGEKYKVYMLLNIKARGLEVHKNEEGSEEGSDEAIGEDIPLEVIVKEKDGEFYIEGLTEYENLEKAKELNEGFK
ncbi:MAG: hypothetical protein E6248_09780 [Clostridium sp.]|uniref:hypothetical protein n=1 Tax=Clostridium sp. TaxID=1506 RepID=UPI00290B430E|nr:hypothetical protein [Clostridium sp.]MDU5110726.1 hypothetical protein [Clostridium sp.]